MSRSNATRNPQTREISIGTRRALSKVMTNAEYAAQVNKLRRASQKAQIAEIQATLAGDYEAAKQHRHTAETFAKLAGPYISRDEW